MPEIQVRKEKLTFREAELADYMELAQLFREGDSLQCSAVPEVFKSPGEIKRTRDYLQRILDDKNSIIFVAIYEKRIIGFVYGTMMSSPESPIYVHRRYSKIHDLVVSHSYRGQGIGTRLMNLIHSWAKEQGASQAELLVWEFNWHAREIYERLGYKTASRVMWKNL
jgi:ribosomal protein S18 acetylase RimI-like enzyme